MRIKVLSVFTLSLVLSFLGLKGVSFFLEKKQAQLEQKQIQIILGDMNFRFKLFLDIQRSLGIIGSQNFSESDLVKKDYGPLNEKVLTINKQILGFNVLDVNGKIIKVFPLETNRGALGNVSQNLGQLRDSARLGKPFWFSPPFTLFQGQQGFSLYHPIMKDRKINGWFATVVGTEMFRKDFDVQEFLASYHLIILDEETQKPFYATGIIPDNTIKSFSKKTVFHDRKISFIIWPKDQKQSEVIPLSWIFIFSFIIAFFLTLLFHFYEQKMKTKKQLQEISMLLNLTSKEAMSKLIELQRNIYLVDSPDNARYITNLIEQIDLLQSTANFKSDLNQEKFEILPLLQEELAAVEDLVNKKNLIIRFAPEKFNGIFIKCNKWLFRTNVFGGSIAYAIIHANNGTPLTIDYRKSASAHNITIHTQQIYQLDQEGLYINFDRRMEVTKKILTMAGGNLRIIEDMAGGILITIELPIIDHHA